MIKIQALFVFELQFGWILQVLSLRRKKTLSSLKIHCQWHLDFLFSDQGMGEPLNNYAAVVEAVRIMTGLPFQLSSKRITVSTVSAVNLTICQSFFYGFLSVFELSSIPHAPVKDVRSQIMPAARAFPLEKLMDALQEYQKNSQQNFFIEYIMLYGVNDEELHAHQLGKLLETFQVVSS
ncbi:hypothetical protein EZV62_013970 [Acer yangbiense]|uniref:Uncharacterized protein n=1 Tax=Acer yangbiense TaxID=1000413 RepID=A0A5C7HQR5_9ROSI|nr:hypothetical protein EZV62_013970 [Acer yangbiense]